MAFDKKRFGDILDRTRNKITDSIKNDVRDLRAEQNAEKIGQRKQAMKKSDNQQLWNKYMREGGKIDVPEFDASVVDLPENDVNEKEIKITPQEPKGISSYIPKQENPEWDLENLAGNGLSQPEPKEPTGTSTYLPNSQNEEMELENLAGNGIEPPPEPKEPSGISSTLPRETDEEWELEDLAGNGQRDTVIVEPTEEPSEVEEPVETEEEVEDTPAPAEGTTEGAEDETREVEDTKAPKEGGSTETKEKEKTEEKKPEEKKPKEKPTEKEKPEKETAKEKVTKTKKQGKDHSDVVKRGSGVSVNDIVDRSAIPHYDYLSFFR